MDGNETINIIGGEVQQRGGILTFPEDAVFKPSMPEGQREGKVTVLSKKGTRLAVLNYENDMLNGLCKFFENLKLTKQITFVNGKMEGWLKEGDKEFIYQNNTREYELVKNEKLEGYVNEINIKTGKINRCYKMNENHFNYS